MAVAIDKKQHTIDELSDLFDEIDVGKNLDIEESSHDDTTSTTGKLRPFADKCEDVKAVMEHELVKDDAPEIEFEPVILEEPEVVTENEQIKQAVEDGADIQESKNPLGLTGENFRAYELIQKKYPDFQLYDGRQAYKDFYRFKVRALKSVLTSYPVLDIKDMNKEIASIRIKYQGSGDLPDPVVIGIKMSECQQARGRLTALLMRAQMQFPAWKKAFEWMNAKLWKDHEMKGAHKREGLSAEHMSDVQKYYCGLQGFLDAATQLDGFLKAIHDSLSRQLTCVIIRDKAGMAHDTVNTELNNEVHQHTVQPDSALDGLDTIEHGTVIPKARVGGLVQRDFAGADIEDDVLQDIG